MQDLLYLALTAAFFTVCFAYVRGLDRIVRAADDAEGAEVAVVTDGIGADGADREPQVAP